MSAKKQLSLITLFLLFVGTVFSQVEKEERWYVKLNGSYFIQMASTEFPSVNNLEPMKKVYKDDILISEESVTGSFGEGARFGGTLGYRFTSRLGLELGINYYNGKEKTMLETISNDVNILQSRGKVTAFDIAPALVLYIGDVKGFKPYTKVGVIVPIHGKLDIKTEAITPQGHTLYRKDQINPNPTCGFQGALGTSYKIYENISAYVELEYRNFSVGSKDKEVKEYSLKTQTGDIIRSMNDLTEYELKTNYHKTLNTNSNNEKFNTVDPEKPMDDLRSYISVSGLGLTLGLRMSF